MSEAHEKQLVSIIHLEDSERDAGLVAGWLEDDGLRCEIKRVQTATEFLTAMAAGGVDLIISDYNLPGFDGLKALNLARQRLPEVPVILFSGAIGEEFAIESLKEGASDYVLKQRPQRLVTAVRQALMRAAERTKSKELEAQFLRAQRMEGIGALAGGIAHDLNNMLAPILMGVELLGAELSPEDRTQTLATMKCCTQRGAEMVKQILAFARGAGGQARVLQMKPLVAEMARLARDTFPRSIRIEVRIEPDLPPVMGNATQLHQVLLNLCVNARDAMPDGGELAVAAGSVVLEDYVAKGELEPLSGQFVVLSVSDTGHGMTPGVLAKIFQPFFTTKGEGKGTGLGLSTVVGITKSHNGFVEVSSEAGNGTAFKVYLPAATSENQAPAQEGVAAPTMGRGEQILVVDDEVAFLEMTRETLETYNYRVLLAQNGAEAVVAYQRQRGEIQAVITDMMMPIMDGPASIQALQRIDPKVRIIGVSGLGSEAVLTRAGKLKTRSFLRKPYTTGTLLATLSEVLNGNVCQDESGQQS